jgi:hypothetical protein
MMGNYPVIAPGAKEAGKSSKAPTKRANGNASSTAVNQGIFSREPKQPPTQPKRENSSSTVSTSTARRPIQPPGTLASPTSFMDHFRAQQAAALKVAASAPAIMKPAAGFPSRDLTDSRWADPAANPVAAGTTKRLARDDFRDPDLSPADLTDGLPSSGQLSIDSPSMGSEGTAPENDAGVGLGIKSPDGPLSASTTRAQIHIDSPDLMDIETSEVDEPALVPTPTGSTHKENLVSLSKEEAEQLEKFKKIQEYAKAGDQEAILKLLNMIPSATSTKPVPSAPEVDTTALSTKSVPSAPTADIIGNSQVLSSGTQTTPSLTESTRASPVRLNGVWSATLLKDRVTKTQTSAASAHVTIAATTTAENGIGYQPLARPAEVASQAAAPIAVETAFAKASSITFTFGKCIEQIPVNGLTTSGSGSHGEKPFSPRIEPSTNANPFEPRESTIKKDGELDYDDTPHQAKTVQSTKIVTSPMVVPPVSAAPAKAAPTPPKPTPKPAPKASLFGSKYVDAEPATPLKPVPKPAPKASLFGSKHADAELATPPNPVSKPAPTPAPKGDLYASKYANPEPAIPSALHNKSPNTGLDCFGAMKSALPIIRSPSPIFGDPKLMLYKGVNPSKKHVAFDSLPARTPMKTAGQHKPPRVPATPRYSAMASNEADEDSDSTL